MRCHRGLVLFAVLILVGSAVLVATAVVFIVSGEVAGGANEREVVRLRAAGLSAVEAVAARLGAQRSLMLEGGTPLLDASFDLWESGGETATVRLLPIDATGATLIAEPGKIALGSATIESLVATGAIGEGLAGRVLALRDAGPRLVSIDALLGPRGGADGLTVEELYGPITELAGALTADPRERRDRALEASVQATLDGGNRAVRDLLTTFAFEPAIQVDGSPRIRLDQEWTDDHRGGIDAALGSGASSLLEAALKSATGGTSAEASGAGNMALLLNAWRTKHEDPREWHALLASVTFGAGPHENRMDILRAPAEALRSLPRVTRDVAERIVRERETLPIESRRSIAWLAEREILAPDACAALADVASTRSFVWRIRVQGSILRERETAPRPGAVFEAVIDCSGERPRIALLRDLSALESVASLLRSSSTDDDDGSNEEDDSRPPNDLIADDFEAVDPMSATGEELDAEADEGSDALATPGMEPPTEPVPSRRGVGRWRRAQ
jgi:hypothetical protein